MISIGDEFLVKADIKPCRAIDLKRDADGVFWIKFIEGPVRLDVEVYKILDVAKDSDGVVYIKLDKYYKGWSLVAETEFMRDFEKITNNPATGLDKHKNQNDLNVVTNNSEG